VDTHRHPFGHKRVAPPEVEKMKRQTEKAGELGFHAVGIAGVDAPPPFAPLQGKAETLTKFGTGPPQQDHKFVRLQDRNRRSRLKEIFKRKLVKPWRRLGKNLKKHR
jgi:hypothetical protein